MELVTQLGINKLLSIFTKSKYNYLRPQNCRQPTDLVCNAPNSCKLLLNTNIPLADCQNKIANYIGIEYRFIPSKDR
jgi:hypothetical protein